MRYDAKQFYLEEQECWHRYEVFVSGKGDNTWVYCMKCGHMKQVKPRPPSSPAA